MNKPKLAEIEIIAFGYKYGPAPQATVVLDLRYLQNPFYQLHLRPLTGLDEPVQRFIEETNPGARELLEQHLQAMLAGFLKYGNDHHKIVFAFGCTGGKHRSRFGAFICSEVVKKFAAENGLDCQVSLQFRDDGRE